ncbi:MAG TPA: hypothetical protein VGL06_18295 [Pseudonocardiaceae bacterium]|jgi:hypothetical protein
MNGADACPDALSLADLGLAFEDLNRRISEHLDWLRGGRLHMRPPGES